MKKPQFRLRDLAWLTLLCALSIAWWLDHRRLKADAASLPELIEINRRAQERMISLQLDYVKQRRDLAKARKQLEHATE
jgi:hypothetical protein